MKQRVLVIEMPTNFMHLPENELKEIIDPMPEDSKSKCYFSRELKTLSRTGVELVSYINQDEYDIDYIEYDALLIKTFKSTSNLPDIFDLNILLDILPFKFDTYDFILASATKLSTPYCVEQQLGLVLLILTQLRNKFIDSYIILGGSSCRHSKNNKSFLSLCDTSYIDKIIQYDINSDYMDRILKKTMVSPDNYEIQFPPAKLSPIMNTDHVEYSYKEIYSHYNLTMPDTSYNDKTIKIADVCLIDGCIGKCGFCVDGDRKLRPIPFSYMKNLIKSYTDAGFKHFRFLHDAINPIADKVCNWLIQDNIDIKWTTDSRHTTDSDYYNMLYEAGCRQIHFGSESVDDKILKYINKGVTIDQIKTSLRLSHEAGIWVTTSFIMSLPYSDPDDYNQVGKFVIDNEDVIQFVNINKFGLFPHSPFHKDPDKYGLKILAMMKNVSDHFIWKEINSDVYKGVLPLSVYDITPDILYRHNTTINVNLHLLYSLYDMLKDKDKIITWLNNNYYKGIKDVYVG